MGRVAVDVGLPELVRAGAVGGDPGRLVADDLLGAEVEGVSPRAIRLGAGAREQRVELGAGEERAVVGALLLDGGGGEDGLEEVRGIGVVGPPAGAAHRRGAAAPALGLAGGERQEAQAEAEADAGELLLPDLGDLLVPGVGDGEVVDGGRPAAPARGRIEGEAGAGHRLERGAEIVAAHRLGPGGAGDAGRDDAIGLHQIGAHPRGRARVDGEGHGAPDLAPIEGRDLGVEEDGVGPGVDRPATEPGPGRGGEVEVAVGAGEIGHVVELAALEAVALGRRGDADRPLHPVEEGTTRHPVPLVPGEPRAAVRIPRDDPERARAAKRRLPAPACELSGRRADGGGEAQGQLGEEGGVGLRELDREEPVAEHADPFEVVGAAGAVERRESQDLRVQARRRRGRAGVEQALQGAGDVPRQHLGPVVEAGALAQREGVGAVVRGDRERSRQIRGEVAAFVPGDEPGEDELEEGVRGLVEGERRVEAAEVDEGGAPENPAAAWSYRVTVGAERRGDGVGLGEGEQQEGGASQEQIDGEAAGRAEGAGAARGSIAAGEGVAEPVAHPVPAEDRQEDGEAGGGEERRPGGDEGLGLVEHPPPGGARRRDPHREVAEHGLGEDHLPHAGAGDHHQRPGEVGQDVPGDDPERPGPQGPGGRDVIERPDLEGAGPHQARGPGPPRAAEHQQHGAQVGAAHRHADGGHEEQEGQRQEHVDQPHGQGVDEAEAGALAHPGDHPDPGADAGRQRGRRHPDRQGDPRAVGEAGEDVPEEGVRAQPVRRRRPGRSAEGPRVSVKSLASGLQRATSGPARAKIASAPTRARPRSAGRFRRKRAQARARPEAGPTVAPFIPACPPGTRRGRRGTRAGAPRGGRGRRP